MNKRIKNTLLGALAVLLGLLASEAFLRLMIPREIAFGTWYSPGIHRPDDRFGFVFTPGYRGVMHHVDRVGGVPLRLDDHGFRLPAGKGERQVVLIGGRSMAFSYGLSDSQTIHSRLSRRLDNATVHTTAWPGFGIVLNWHAYLDLFEPQTPADVAIVCFYGAVGPDFADVDEAFTLPPPAPHDELFHFFPDLVVPADGRISLRLGPTYYRSYVGHHLLALADKRFAADLDESARRVAPPDVPERFAALLSKMNEHFRARGTPMLVAFLPRRGREIDFYEPWTPHVPDGIPWLDLHVELSTQFKEDDWIASGHYGPRAAEMVAEALANGIEKLPGHNHRSSEDVVLPAKGVK